MNIASLMNLTFVQGHKCVKIDYYLTCHISYSIQAITFKHGMTVDQYMACMPMLISVTLTLTQGHSGSAEAKIQC